MSTPRSTFAELRAATGFLADLPPFLRRRVTLQAARHALERQLAARDTTFARILQRAVFEHARSPYRRLFEWARITRADVTALLASVGLEGTLERLHDAGIYVTLEEFKGLRPLRRPGLELPLGAEDFDNPLSARQYEAHTGGSGGNARRILIGLDLIEHECAYHAGFFAAHAAENRAVGMWLPAPPGAVAIKNVLIRAKLGRPIARWFSQNRLEDAPARHRALPGASRLVAGLFGSRMPAPEFTPPQEAGRVVRWLAEERAKGSPAVMLTTPSSAVRTCAEAVARGIDISGSLFVLVGEPYTQAKADVVRAAQCSGASHYAMVEAGMIGLACHAPSAPDDVHLVSDKIATIERTRQAGSHGEIVPALFHTTLLTASPKVMLNVESGDYGVREERDCGCRVLPPAFRSHLHSIRSYEKLTSEGMHLLTNDLLLLVERVLPRRFGGHPTDYQFEEGEQHGLPKVSIVVRPSVGAVDSDEVVRATLEFLRQRGAGQRLMAAVWTTSETLRVVRAEPHVTFAGKIQPLRKLTL